MWPDNILAASLNPNEIFLAKYEINSIRTSKGNKPSGQPAGTKREKNSNPCLLKPNIVAPSTTVKLNEKVNIKWLVEAKLYGTIPIKLLTNIKTNKTYINGKYIWPFLSLIWLTTILCTVAYTDSCQIDQEFDMIWLLLLEIRFNTNTRYPPKVKYNPIFVIDKDKLPNTGAFKLIKSLISNWSNGLIINE